MSLNFRNLKTLVVILVALLLTVTSCMSVKPYQRAFLNDGEMKPGALARESFDQNVYSYREGSVITGGSKSKGGCGCN